MTPMPVCNLLLQIYFPMSRPICFKQKMEQKGEKHLSQTFGAYRRWWVRMKLAIQRPHTCTGKQMHIFLLFRCGQEQLKEKNLTNVGRFLTQLGDADPRVSSTSCCDRIMKITGTVLPHSFQWRRHLEFWTRLESPGLQGVFLRVKNKCYLEAGGVLRIPLLP